MDRFVTSSGRPVEPTIKSIYLMGSTWGPRACLNWLQLEHEHLRILLTSVRMKYRRSLSRGKNCLVILLCLVMDFSPQGEELVSRYLTIFRGGWISGGARTCHCLEQQGIVMRVVWFHTGWSGCNRSLFVCGQMNVLCMLDYRFWI